MNIDFGGIFQPVILAIATVLGVLLSRLLASAIDLIKNQAIRGIVWQGVLWVEQKYQGAKGSDKFRAAYDRLASKLPFISGEDLEMMIEAAVGELNSQIPKPQGS